MKNEVADRKVRVEVLNRNGKVSIIRVGRDQWHRQANSSPANSGEYVLGRVLDLDPAEAAANAALPF